MFYRLKKLPYKSRPWKVQKITHKDGRRRDIDLSENEYIQLGFHLALTYEDASARKKQLNAQAHDERHEERRRAIEKRLKEEDRVLDAYLNDLDVKDFEEQVLYRRFKDTEFLKRNKIESHWRATKRVLCSLKIDPPFWINRKDEFYDYFSKNNFSPAYVQKVIRIINMWGGFHSRKYQRFFDPLPFPKGYEKEKIADAYFEKNGAGNTSDPISVSQLKSIKEKIDPELFNWLSLSLWFGLRPSEVDSLKDHKNFRIETHNGKPILFVYQSKLTAIAREKRWKYIPCLFPEQEEGLRIIASGKFRRPSPKPIKSHFGENTTLYGGRKGFEALMKDLGYALEDISIWMGHQSIERTWKSYKNKQRVFIPKKIA